MCSKKHLFREFKRFQGQPVRVFTDDGRVHRGIDADVGEDFVRLVDKHGCMEFIEFAHIDAVMEPRMELCRCDHDDCDDHHHHDKECDRDEDFEIEIGEEEEEFEGFRGRRR